jgi:methyl-accepting chemotaxis protein PixJ
MATPESLKDPIENNNGHHDYSESISDFLSNIDDLDDLDLSGIFNSSASSTEDDFVTGDLVAHDLVTDEPMVDEPVVQNLVAKIEEEPVEEEPAAHVEIESSLISFEIEETELEPIHFEAASAEIEAEQVLEIYSPEPEAANIEAESLHVEVEAACTEVETAQLPEPVSYEPVATQFESQDIKTETDPAGTEVNSVPETSHLQAKIADFEVKDVESESTPLYVEAASTEIQAAQATEIAEFEAVVASFVPEEIKAETEVAQVPEVKDLEPELAYVDLEEIRAQLNPIKAEVKAASLETEAKLAPVSLAAPHSAAKLLPAAAKGHWFQRLNLRTKATLLAMAIGTLPVVATGTLAYLSTSPEVRKSAIEKQESRAYEASELASRFMFARYGDIQALSNLPIFSNRKGTVNVTQAQRQKTLDKYIQIYGVYDSIAEFDLEGNVLNQSTGLPLPNDKNSDYFQEVLKTQKPFISQPGYSKLTQEFVVHFAAPVFDVETGKMTAVVRSRMPVKYLSELIQGKKSKDKAISSLQEVFLVEQSGTYFVSGKVTEIGLEAEKDFSILPSLRKAGKAATNVYFNPNEKIEELVTYSPSTQLEGLPDLNWSVLVASKTKESFSALYNLRLALILGSTAAALLVGALAVYLANRATRPIIASAAAVRKIGQGELDTRVSISGQDEMADLGNNINAMAEQLQTFLNQQEQETLQKQRFTEISQAREPQALEAPLNILLAEIREVMQLDRAVVYRFYPDWSGHIVGESVLPGWPVALADKIEDACIPQALLDAYKKGRFVPTSDVFNAGFHPDHLELMKRLQIKANLVVPILQGEELFGILVAHHCAKTHDWQQSEIEYLQTAASKLGGPLGSLALFERKEYEAEQERNRNQGLQMELMNLLGDVQGASDGDLTVRADVSAGEIGIVADFFNSIVESLRDIVSQVKDASAQVNTSVGSNEVVMGQLADDAQVQAQQVTNTLKSVEQMALSIQEVAENARKASKVAGLASTTAESGGKTMDRTVDSILMLRETVAETSKKVKRLGESSQQISKAVSLINQIALQTNLLAINASIEAARAGKEGRGFAVVAEEVGALAAQSAEATKEIEQIVENIQSETGEVVDAMERGTTQVVEGTRQVEEAKESLQQIVKVSRQIDELLQSISSATVSQTEASEVVKQLMQQVTQSSERTSDTSRQVSGSLQETVAIAQRLQASVGTFKVEN